MVRGEITQTKENYGFPTSRHLYDSNSFKFNTQI